MKRDYIVIDVETGGLDPKKNSLLSIGIIFVKDNKVRFLDEFFVKSGVYNVTPGAMIVNNYDWNKHNEHQMKPEEIADAIKEIYGYLYGPLSENSENKPKLIGHNVQFDVSFILENIFDKKTLDSMVGYRYIDTCSMLAMLEETGFEIEGCSLTKGLKTFGIEFEEKNMHSALYDAEKTFKLFSAIISKVKVEVD